MVKPSSPPRPLKGSPLLGRHASPVPLSLSLSASASASAPDRPAVIYSTSSTSPTTNNTVTTTPRPLDRSHVAIAPTSSTTSAPSSIYSSTPSSYSSEVSNYPPIHPDRPQLPSLHAAYPAAMAPSTAMARNSMLVPELPPTSTPTGRISKAKKGKRVHACEYPGCGKVFTRAEHKRRHELNHNPDASYHCRQSGCNKSFHRLDLLQRHQERHDLEATGIPHSHRKYPSQPSVVSEAPPTMPISASPQFRDHVSRPSAGGMSIDSLLHRPPHTFATDAFGITVGSYPMTWANASEESLFPGLESSPVPDRYPHRQSLSSASSVTGCDVSGSPLVTVSLPSSAHWMPSPAPPTVLPGNMFGDDYMPSHAVPTVSKLSIVDGNEWAVISGELSAQSGLLSSPGGSGVSDTVRWYCLDFYWQYFHPTFPIVHRPTFFFTNPSPLLACVMVAIGSYYDDKADAKTYSLTLLDIATKILRGRNNINSKSRAADLQTVVLLEILSTFCARQISVQMSTRFRALFANLNQNQRWLTTNPLAIFRTLKPNYARPELERAHKFFVENETRSRILHACAVFDNQQALLFEQSHTVRRHVGLRVNVTNATQSVHLPCDDDLWDASPIEKWAQLAQASEYTMLANGKPVSPRRAGELSFFQTQVVSAHVDHHTPASAKSGATPHVSRSKWPPSMPETFTNSAFNHHVSELCRHTPIRALLMVTGESWLLGRKIEKPADYKQARHDLRRWVDGAVSNKPPRAVADSLVALWHALKIFKGLMSLAPATGLSTDEQLFGTTCIIHENWAIYLACLVCWAHGRRSEPLQAINAGALLTTTSGTVTAAATTTPDFRDVTPVTPSMRPMTPLLNSGGRVPNNLLSTIDPNFSTPTLTSPPMMQPNNSHQPQTHHHYATHTPMMSPMPHVVSVPPVAAMDASFNATQEAQTYLLFTDAASPAAMRDVDPSVLSRTQGLLETIRQQTISRSLMGGLMTDAQQVLYRLASGRASAQF